MSFSPFTYLSGASQLRQVAPAGYQHSRNVGTPAVAVTSTPAGGSEPFTYNFSAQPTHTLTAIVDGESIAYAIANTGFVDPANATAEEVVAELNASAGAALGRLTFSQDGSFIRATTLSTGEDATLAFADDATTTILRFPTTTITGRAGQASLVLGSARPGVFERLSTGAYVEAQQSVTFDESLIRVHGVARIPDAPAGVAWVVSVRDTTTELVSRTYLNPGEYSLSDLIFTVAQRGGTTTNLSIRLHVVGVTSDTPGLDGRVLELPSVFIDGFESIRQSEVAVINRQPHPNETGVDASTELEISIDLASVIDGVAVASSATQVFVDGDLVVSGGAIVDPRWSYVSALVAFGFPLHNGPNSTDAIIRLRSNPNLITFESEQMVTVRVVSAHTGAIGAVDTTYSFRTRDTTPLQVSSAQARDKRTVRITFNDSVDTVAALIPANYTFETVTRPAVTVVASNVTLVSPNEVDVTTDIEFSQGADYVVSAFNLTDDTGNPLSGVTSASFTGFVPNIPAGRYFQFWELFPEDVRRRDTTGDFRTFALCIQDVIDLLLCSIDDWVQVFDVERAPEPFVDAILCDLGNPFNFIDLSDNDKRRLAITLTTIYSRKGTAAGIIDTVRFLTGVDITIEVVNARTDFWEVGRSRLGTNTVIAPPSGSPLWYSFRINAATELTQEQRDQILQIATYMKPAHEHILGIRDITDIQPLPPVFWNLGVTGQSELGLNTVLGN